MKFKVTAEHEGVHSLFEIEVPDAMCEGLETGEEPSQDLKDLIEQKILDEQLRIQELLNRLDSRNLSDYTYL